MGHVSNSQVIFKTVGVALDEAVPDSFSAGAERMIYASKSTGLHWKRISLLTS